MVGISIVDGATVNKWEPGIVFLLSRYSRDENGQKDGVCCGPVVMVGELQVDVGFLGRLELIYTTA